MQENTNKPNGQDSNSNSGTGRINEGNESAAAQQENTAADISQVDQQEGAMNNGELGGNFNTDNEDENNNNQSA